MMQSKFTLKNITDGCLANANMSSCSTESMMFIQLLLHLFGYSRDVNKFKSDFTPLHSEIYTITDKMANVPQFLPSSEDSTIQPITGKIEKTNHVRYRRSAKRQRPSRNRHRPAVDEDAEADEEESEKASEHPDDKAGDADEKEDNGEEPQKRESEEIVYPSDVDEEIAKLEADTEREDIEDLVDDYFDSTSYQVRRVLPDFSPSTFSTDLKRNSTAGRKFKREIPLSFQTSSSSKLRPPGHFLKGYEHLFDENILSVFDHKPLADADFKTTHRFFPTRPQPPYQFEVPYHKKNKPHGGDHETADNQLEKAVHL